MAKILKLGIGLVLFSAGTEIAWRLWKKYTQNHETERNNELYTDVLLFSLDNAQCREHALKLIACDLPQCPGKNIRKLVEVFDAAEVTLDVCIYILTYKDITDAIIRAQGRDVSVRVIVDPGMSDTDACSGQLTRLREAGIKIRILRSDVSLMHHKFVIADGRLVAFGSTNWTMQAFFGNFDATVITSQDQLITVFSDEFNRIWETVDVGSPRK